MSLYPTNEEVVAEVKRKIHPSTKRQNLLIVIFAFTIFIPALDICRTPDNRLLGFMANWPIELLLLIACAGGSIGLAFWYPDPGYRRVGIGPGILIGLGVFGATILYTSFRSSVFLVELMIPICLGLTPGFLLYNWLVKRKALGDQRTRRSTVR